MLLGARQFFEKRGAPTPSVPTARDYVQTGLVAMWDGIENAGWGVHNANAANWVDLIGGFSLPTGRHMEWSPTALQMRPTSNSDAQAGFNDVSANDILSSIANSAWTIEVGYSFPVARANNMIFQLRDYGYAMQNGSIVLRFSTYYNTKVSSDGGCYSIVFNGNSSISLFRNAVASWSGSGTANTLTTGTIRMNNLGNGTVDIDYNFVRLYSRALTSDELAHNYAKDKERFNLP